MFCRVVPVRLFCIHYIIRMGFIKFDKTQLINLGYSLNKEMVRANRAGSFSCTTILGCNTRKYHGLLISHLPDLDEGYHVLLSKVDETVIQREAEFNLGVNRFPGLFSPKGHKYVRDFGAERIPVVTYRVGGVVLNKETMFVTGQHRVLIRYTLLEAQSPTTLRLRPFLAFRNIHMLSKQNIDARTRYDEVPNGIKTCLYHGYPELYMQFSTGQAEYTHVPDWYKDFEYVREKERGYACHEDLFTPGFFDIPIRKGESIIFSASTAEARPAGLARMFSSELSRRTPRNSFRNCLINSSEQFFHSEKKESRLLAGYPWYGELARYSFISLPGLSLAPANKVLCQRVLDRMLTRMQGPRFPESSPWNEMGCDAADSSLWFIWALQQLHSNRSKKKTWATYGQAIKTILQGYVNGFCRGVSLHENGLIHIDSDQAALTWMNARIEGSAVSPRYGYVVEVNALWYNALRFAASLADGSGDNALSATWDEMAERVKNAFAGVFWNTDNQCLSDYVANGKGNTQLRPNQVLAVSLPFSPLDASLQKSVVDAVRTALLTPRGLRSLSPQDTFYKGIYAGNEHERNAALHQGCAFPWLLGHFSEAYLKVYGMQGAALISELLDGFADTMKEDGIGSVSEMYEGDPPHKACGAISFAPSVAELMRMQWMLRRLRALESAKKKQSHEQKQRKQ